ncbi:uncharacterized protein [Watersipora subatra]|uniref:uncharacterized protein n=1 Tax=Watersipora subatra TaxID=2589382 RepID=UPI00355AD658
MGNQLRKLNCAMRKSREDVREMNAEEELECLSAQTPEISCYTEVQSDVCGNMVATISLSETTINQPCHSSTQQDQESVITAKVQLSQLKLYDPADMSEVEEWCDMPDRKEHSGPDKVTGVLQEQIELEHSDTIYPILYTSVRPCTVTIEEFATENSERFHLPIIKQPSFLSLAAVNRNNSNTVLNDEEMVFGLTAKPHGPDYYTRRLRNIKSVLL